MYKFKVEKDQQQSTNLTFSYKNNIVVVKCCRIQHLHLHHPQTNLLLDFTVHENHDQNPFWSALQHNLKISFESIVASERLPISSIKCHIFVLNQDEYIQSSIFNAVWLSFIIHGVPLNSSVFMLQWQQNTTTKGKAVYNIHEPTFPLSGEYSSPPPIDSKKQVEQYRQSVLTFLSHELS